MTSSSTRSSARAESGRSESRPGVSPGGSISEKKAAIESAAENLKKAVEEKNIADIDRYNSELEAAWHAASEDMAKAAQASQQGPQGGFNGGAQGPQDDNTPDEQ